MPTAPEVARNRDSLFRIGTTAISITCRASPSPRRWSRWSPAPDGDQPRAVLPREERGARDLGRLSLRSRRRARDLRLRRGVSDSASSTRAARRWRRPSRAVTRRSDSSRDWDREVTDLLNEVRNRVRTGVSAPDEVVDVRARARRDAPRQGRARDRADAPRRARSPAARIGARWRPRARAGTNTRSRPSSMHEFLRHGAQAVAYSSIVASGPERLRAALPRQQPADARRRPAADRRRLRVPGLRVGHHAHVSRRTAGSPGRRRTSTSWCSPSQLACLDAVKPGAEFHDYHKVAERVLAQGFIDLGPVQGHARRGAGERQLQAVLHAPRRPLARHGRARRRPLPGRRARRSSSRPAWCSPSSRAPTSGPADNVPEAFWNIGVRIEDDVLVTADGIENLTAATPKTVADVEAACRR